MAIFKSPRTQRERKQYFDALDQGYKPRAKRRHRNLPDEWDDIVLSDFRGRNWKLYRKTRWRYQLRCLSSYNYLLTH